MRKTLVELDEVLKLYPDIDDSKLHSFQAEFPNTFDSACNYILSKKSYERVNFEKCICGGSKGWTAYKSVPIWDPKERYRLRRCMRCGFEVFVKELDDYNQDIVIAWNASMDQYKRLLEPTGSLKIRNKYDRELEVYYEKK